jgi:polysaccharide export outer membrane protein
VKYPGTYSIKKGETLSSLLARSGGFLDKAYLKGAVLTRLSVKAIQKEQLLKAIDRAEAAVLVKAGEKTMTGVETDEAKRTEVMARQQLQLLATLKKVEPLGRIIIRLDDSERLRGTPGDIALQNGDSLFIPQIPQTVNVVGAVYNPTGIIYSPHRMVKDYIHMAGGPTDIAANKEIYIIKVNGSAVSRRDFHWYGVGRSWDGSDNSFHIGKLGSLTLDPGDTIIVPERLERIAWLREIKDIATIIGNLALAGGVALVTLR